MSTYIDVLLNTFFVYFLSCFLFFVLNYSFKLILLLQLKLYKMKKNGKFLEWHFDDGIMRERNKRRKRIEWKLLSLFVRMNT